MGNESSKQELGTAECSRANALQLATFQPGSDDRDNSAEKPACCPIERPQSGAHESWETGLLDLGQAEV